MTIPFDMDAALAAKLSHARAALHDSRFEQFDPEFHGDGWCRFLEFAKANSGRILVLDVSCLATCMARMSRREPVPSRRFRGFDCTKIDQLQTNFVVCHDIVAQQLPSAGIALEFPLLPH